MKSIIALVMLAFATVSFAAEPAKKEEAKPAAKKEEVKPAAKKAEPAKTEPAKK
jgi:hypothetical protein